MNADSSKTEKPAGESYCWIRVLGVTDDATVPTQSVFVHQESLAKHGGRPPARIASTSEVLQTRNGQELKSVTVWSGVSDYSGRASADTVFDYGPVFGDQDCAIDWLTGTSDGQQWQREALNFMLMQVAWGSTVKPARDFCDKGPVADTACNPSPAFPADAWSDTACIRHIPAKLQDLLFDPDKIECPDICNTQSGDECNAIADAMNAVTTGSPADQAIRRQAHSMGHALLPIFAVIGVDPDQPASRSWKKLIEDVAVPAEAAIFLQKRKHARRRPAQACQLPKPPMFSQEHPVDGGAKRPHLLYPGHPSYPSGHAVMAYVWAGLIKMVRGDVGDKVERAAKQVADNRVAAGLHFPSDVSAATQMAASIVTAIWSQSNDQQRTFVKDLTKLAQ